MSTRCGAIIDVDVSCVYQNTKSIDGHKIEEIQGYFKGICINCLKELGNNPQES